MILFKFVIVSKNFLSEKVVLFTNVRWCGYIVDGIKIHSLNFSPQNGQKL